MASSTGVYSRNTLVLSTAGMFVTVLLLWNLLALSPSTCRWYGYEYSRPFALASPTPGAPTHEQTLRKGLAAISTTADKFTPEVLLSAPRRSTAETNDAGTFALYSVSTYSFKSHTKTSEIRLLDLTSKQSTLVTNEKGASEPHWLEDEIIYLKAGDNGETQVIVTSVENTMKNYTAAVVPGSIGDLKLKVLEPGKVAVVAAGRAARNGSLYNAEAEPEKLSTGMLYDKLFVRHWDTFTTPQTNALFHGLFQLTEAHVSKSKGRWTLSQLHNALLGTNLESPLPPFPSTDHYDLSTEGIVFVAKDPDLNPAFNTKCNSYFIPLESFAEPRDNSSDPRKIQLDGFDGAATGPTFSPSGKAIAFMQMKENGYESDKNRLILIPDIKRLESGFEVLTDWDRSPAKVVWSHDSRTFFLLADEEARSSVFQVKVPTTDSTMNRVPEKLTSSGSVSDFRLLKPRTSDELFLSSTSLVDNSLYSTLDPGSMVMTEVSSNSRHGSSFGISPSQVSSIWFPGAGNYKVHAWVIKPSNFDANTTYPLAYLIHGGPQGAWEDSWSTRWNPVVFAEQGYVVVAPNPTGSTSYGADFTNRIQNNWGGTPYKDLASGFEYIKSNLDYVDTNRAVALGASYGGYMINWINGQPLGRKMKALVGHDGVFSMFNQVSSDEQWFPTHDLGGTLWSNASSWSKWDPARFIGNWETPQLVIHSSLDYRLPITEGLAAFNVLQGKGIKSKFLTFPDENHWVLKEENSLVWHTVVFNWINSFVGLPKYRDEPEVQNSFSGRR